jgi:hypothetical protein
MYIVIQHEIQDPQLFQKCAEEVFPLPEHLQLHQFFPSADMKKAVCLYEAPSVDKLSVYLDAKLNPASEQFYFPVLTENAMGLPNS